MFFGRSEATTRAGRGGSAFARWTADWSLRSRLVVQTIGLLAVLCVAIGGVTEFLLHDSLVGQLDEQLRAASGRSASAGARPPPESRPRPGPDFLDRPGQAVGTFGARVVNGQVQAAVINRSSGQPELVPSPELAALNGLDADGLPRTVMLGPLGDYRMIAVREPDGDVMITGLPLDTANETSLNLALTLGGVALAGLLAAGIAGALIVRRTLRPLERVAATASRVVELPLDRGEVALSVRVPEEDTNPRTEVGKVGSALNRMLGHIADALAARHESELRVRRFVADASHELRTPLASIRGYAELTRRSGAVLPPDVTYAMSRVESESKRMTTLVEDLLLLARLDSGRPVAQDPVDLSRLVADALADAHVAGPEHRWLLRGPAESLIVLGDAGPLHQVVTNLLTNARAHTPPGSVVTVSLEADPATREAVLAVADDGPGIPADLLPEVFERFTRGDTSRSRAAGSTGLGLSIVAAVIAAQHGTVDVDSSPKGTTFTVRLPLATP